MAALTAKVEVQEEEAEALMEDAGEGDEEDDPEDEYEGEEGEGADAEFPAARDDGGPLTDREKILRTALVVRPLLRRPCAARPCRAALLRAPPVLPRLCTHLTAPRGQAVSKKSRSSFHCLFHLGLMYFRTQMYSKAKESFQRSLDGLPPHPSPPPLRPAGIGVLSRHGNPTAAKFTPRVAFAERGRCTIGARRGGAETGRRDRWATLRACKQRRPASRQTLQAGVTAEERARVRAHATHTLKHPTRRAGQKYSPQDDATALSQQDALRPVGVAGGASHLHGCTMLHL